MTTNANNNAIVATHETSSGCPYAMHDGKWHFLDERGNWNLSENSIEWLQENLKPINAAQELQPAQLSGGSCNYYMVDILRPTTIKEPYKVECNDLIEALQLNPQESNILKEIFRTANERAHNNGKAGNTPLRAAQKVLFFAVRNAILNGVDVDGLLSEINTK